MVFGSARTGAESTPQSPPRTIALISPRVNYPGGLVHLSATVTMTGSATETSAGLMRLAADGDELAFASLVDAYHADMSSVCFVVTGGDAELTEEAVQSAWPIAWRKLHTIREPERLRPWLISIAVNEARQLGRRRRRGRVLEISVARDPSAHNPVGPRVPRR